MVKRNVKVKFISNSEKCKIGDIGFMSPEDAKAYQEHGFVEILEVPEIKKNTKKKYQKNC